MKKKTVKVFAFSIVAILVTALSVTAFALSAPAVQTDESSLETVATAKEVRKNPYIVYDQPGKFMVSGHRAGGDLYPENTLMAIEECLEHAKPDAEVHYVVDVLEFDLHLTKDDELILLHDDNFDRTTDSVEVWGKEGVLPRDKTYAEIQELNFGYWFPYERGAAAIDESKRVYKDLDSAENAAIAQKLRAVRLEDVFATTTAMGFTGNYIIEIKDSGTVGKRAADKLCSLMQQYDMFDRIVIGTFNGDISDYLDNLNASVYDGRIIRSAGILEVLKAFLSYLMNRELGNVKYSVLQIPYLSWFPFFGSKGFIKFAHKNNIACQFWTVNEASQMETLILNGADCIMSDNPKTLYEVTLKVQYAVETAMAQAAAV